MSPDGNDNSVSIEDKKDLISSFIKTYMSEYKHYIEHKELDERHLPSFYKGFPYSVQAFELPNGGLCVLFKKGKSSRTVVSGGEFDDIRDKLAERSFDFMKTFPPFTKLSDEEAERISRTGAELDLDASKRLEILGNIESHMDEVTADIKKMLELNPWLDDHATTQNDKMGNAKNLILELYKEIELDESERFGQYERELAELQAFEMAQIEEVAGEMELEVETAMSEMDEQVGQMSSDFEEFKTEIDENVEGLKGIIRDLKKKVDAIQAMGGASEDIDADIKGLRDSIRKANTKIGKIDKVVRETKKELEVTGEVKETVFRDSKRIHNLNERTGDLETEVKKIASIKGKNYDADIKAIIKRLDKFEKDVEKMVKKAVDFEVEKNMPKLVVEQPPPPPELDSPLPLGAAIKKTTKKKKTTKRRKKKA